MCIHLSHYLKKSFSRYKNTIIIIIIIIIIIMT